MDNYGPVLFSADVSTIEMVARAVYYALVTRSPFLDNLRDRYDLFYYCHCTCLPFVLRVSNVSPSLHVEQNS